MMRTHQLPPSAGRVISSLRDAGYDFNTAVADIVDNSIAAQATSVWISALMDSNDGQIDIAIVDNGAGMSPDEVMNAMKYGSDERSDCHSLGKFGLGLKTASSSQCRRISLISRKSGEEKPFKLVLDIDHALKEDKWEYIELEPTRLDLNYLRRIADGHSGTVVRWEKCDRILPRKYRKPGGQTHQAAFDKKIEALRFHLAIVFHRFLDSSDNRAPNVVLRVNGVPVRPWNPFCSDLEKTETTFRGDVAAETSLGTNSAFHVAAFIVPSRGELADEEMERVFPKGITPDKLQGIYVFRENRLIHWGDWCQLCRTEFHYRLCRIELSFDASLDELFNVDFKKSRISIDTSVGEYLAREVVVPARKAAEARYRNQETQQHAYEADQLHAKSNAAIKRQAVSSRGYKAEKLLNGKPIVTSQSGAQFIDPIPVIEDAGVEPVIAVPDLPDSLLWQPRITGRATSEMQTSVEVNVSHPFYQKAYSLCKDNPNAIKALDYVLWSLANAEYSAKDAGSLQNFEELRREVSRNLRRLADELPNP